jgi:hypothetical protein
MDNIRKYINVRKDKFAKISSKELELYIEGVVITIKVKDSSIYNHIKLKEIVSAECANVFQLLKHYSTNSNISGCDIIFLELRNLFKEEKEIIYRAIHIMDWQDKNKLFINIVNDIRMTMKDKINRLKVLEGSIEAGHSNPEVLEELLELYQYLNRMKILPNSHASKMAKQYSNLFLKNVKIDNKAQSLGVESK